MALLITTLAITTLLGSAIIGGIFYGFSSFVMQALAKLPPDQGIAAMQSINIVVITPSFLGVFIGTALLAAALPLLAFTTATLLPEPALLFLIGSSCYWLGTFLVTLVFNVPLNNKLAKIQTDEPTAIDVWHLYLDRWMRWNHVRTAAALIAVLFYIAGLMQSNAL